MKQSWFALSLLLVSTWAYPNVKIQVEGHGPTVELAKKNAFQHAIEQVVGQVIVSDQEANGDQLVKDFVGGYSAGYVDDYEILSSEVIDQGIVVKMNVSVASSKIAERMRSSGNKTLMLDGERVQAQLDTQLEQRRQGDQLIAEILSSYPYNAYVVNSGTTEFAISRLREPYVDIPYEIHWSKFWLDATNEALKLISIDSKSCGWLKMRLDNQMQINGQPGLFTRANDTLCGREADARVLTKNQVDSYYFADLGTVNVVKHGFIPEVGRPTIGLRVDLIDTGGNVVDSRCANIDTSLFVSTYQPQLEIAGSPRPVINGQASVYGILRVHLHKDIENVFKTKLTVEKTCV